MRLDTGLSVDVTACLAAVTTIAAGGTGEITYVHPPPPPGTEVTLNLVPDPEDAAVAAALGPGSL